MTQRTLIPYIGGKFSLADWIVEHLPEHKLYCEPFGGSGAVLKEKPRSDIEIYNDTYDEVVNFMEVLGTQPEELEQRLKFMPYSRKLYKEYQEDILTGEVPDDSVERAARFFLVANASINADLTANNGFKASKGVARARTFEYKKGDLEELGERMRGVIVENQDYKEVVKQFDRPEAVFYCDPPYLGKDLYYTHEEDFDHSEFISFMDSIEGKVLISYGSEVPDLPDGWFIIQEKEILQNSNHIKNDEVLVANYDPRQDSWSGENSRIDFDF